MKISIPNQQSEDHGLLQFSKEGVEQPYTMNGLPVKKITARHRNNAGSSLAAFVGWCFPQTKRKITNNVAIGGYPPWSPKTNRHYPVEFKRVVKTLLMIHSVQPKTQKPRHPECLLYLLPMELLLAIIKLAVLPCYRMSSIFIRSLINIKSFLFSSQDHISSTQTLVK